METYSLLDHAAHVLIRGYVFAFADKAPFVQSGASLLGAIEFDHAAGKLRCHECRAWFRRLSAHIHKHGLTAREYKKRHGIAQTTALLSPDLVAHLSRTSTEKRGAAIAQFAAAGNRSKQCHASRSNEMLNIAGRCEAQTLFRIQVLAAEIGHTPSLAELRAAGFSTGSLTRMFGSINRALRACGLETVNRKCSRPPLPAGFPSREALLDVRMPWPKEYFGLRYTRTPATL